MITVPRKIRFASLLPVIQVVITATLTIWGDKVEWIVLGNSRRIPGRLAPLHMLVLNLQTMWRGVNAPVFPLNLPGMKPLGVILYLVAVAVLWRAVGRALDRRRGVIAPLSKNLSPVLMLFWGVLLLIIFFVPQAWAYGAGGGARPIEGALYLCWSLILITVGIMKIKARAMRTGSRIDSQQE